MSDLATMLWKETAELLAGARALRFSAVIVLFLGVMPALTGVHNPTAAALESVGYVLITAVFVTAQSAPELVLRERAGHSLETLLATRLPDQAIFAGKVLSGAAVGYLMAMTTLAVQLVAFALVSHTWSWLGLSDAAGAWLILGGPAVIAIYLATVGTFVAMRVGDQRSAYLVTILSLGVLALPPLLHLVTIATTAPGLRDAVLELAVLDAVLLAVGARLFRRERLILYLQE
jgi:hypothetical protein